MFHPDREYLKFCLGKINNLLKEELHLEFNEKTQILPIRNGINYLGWHLYQTETGKVIRKLKTQSKKRAVARIRKLQEDYAQGTIDWEQAKQALTGYDGYFRQGHTWHLRKKLIYSASFVRNK